MTIMKRMLAGGAAVAAIAVAAPASAQYAYPYGYNPYAQQNPYASGYGYNNSAYMTQVATQQCTAAVQQRLSTRTGLSGVLASFLGVPTAQPRVLNITRVDPRRSTIRVRGLASSGRHAYSPYGYGAYGALGAAYQPDLSFRCDVDYRGYIRSIDIDRR